MRFVEKQIGGSSVFWIILALFSRPMAAGPVEFQTEELPRAIQGAQYETSIRTSVDGRCPAGNVALFVASGALPRGLHTTEDGLAGVPREMGLFRFWIGARNTCASTIRVYELLVTGRPILQAVPEKIAFTVSPDSQPVSQTSLISSTWPGLPYRLSSPDSWLTLQQARGTVPEEGSALMGDRATVIAIPKKLAPGVYHGTVIVSAWRADAIEIEVTIVVTAPPAAPYELPHPPDPFAGAPTHTTPAR
jgi:hypothetical protein